MSDSLKLHGLQHTRPPCPSTTPGVYSDSCPSSQYAIQPSYPLLSPSSPAFKFSQHQGLFQWVSSSHQVAKYIYIYVCVCVWLCECAKSLQSYPTLCNTMDGIWLFVTQWTVAHQAPLSMGFSRQEYCSGLPCPPPGDLPDPGIEPASLTSPSFLYHWFLYH